MAGSAERTARVAAPAALALFVVIGAALSDGPLVRVLPVAVATIAVGIGLALVGARGWVPVPGLLLAAAGVTALCWAQPANLGWFAICVLAGWAAFRASHLAAAVTGAVLVVGFVVQWSVVTTEPGWGAWIAGTVFTVTACLMAQRQADLLEQLRAAQADLARSAAAEERTRIAHELHDVIGHALTVSLLHVTSARLALAEDPEEAAASLAEAERLAQQSLAEVRSVVGLMRDAGSSAPLPGGADLDALVDSFRRAGTTLDWRVDGDPASLGATEGLTVYRILQEALTNAVRHAPGSPVTARLVVDGSWTRVLVESDGPPGPGPADLATVVGGGLAGMRSRAEAVGGRVDAGPAASGWRVEAVLPA